MLAIDWRPDTPEWTALTFTGTHIAHVADGHADAIIRVSGVQRVTVGDEQLDGLIRSSETTNDAPHTFTGARRALWEKQRA